MAKLDFTYKNAYKRYSDYFHGTYISPTQIVEITHGKFRLYIIPKQEEYWETYYCEVMNEEEFNKKYSLEVLPLQ